MGVSAGGGLAVALAKKLRDQGALAQPALLVLASPWVTLGTDAAAFTRNHAYAGHMRMERVDGPHAGDAPHGRGAARSGDRLQT